MERSGSDDQQKDPSMLVESRLRPWVTDDAEEEKLQNALDDLDNALTDISPVKDALGFSVLDPTLPRDDRGQMFEDEIARLQPEKTSCQGQHPASGCPDERPIGEVFEDLYREWRDARGDGARAATAEEAEAPAGESQPEGRMKEDDAVGLDQSEVPPIASDPDVTRLLTELQHELDDASRSSGSSDGRSDAGSREGCCPEDNEEDSEMEHQDGGGERGEDCIHLGGDHESLYGLNGDSDYDNSSKNGDRGLFEEHREGGHSHQLDRNPPTASGDERGGHTGIYPPSRRHLPRGSPEPRRLDISRIKIDGIEGGVMKANARPSSAPAPSVSGTAVSGLSRTASSCLVRTMSKRLTEAARATEMQSEAGCGGGARVSRAGQEAPQEEFGTEVVKHLVEALKGNNSVRRTSYLRGRRRPRGAKWLPRDTTMWHVNASEVERGACKPPPRGGPGGQRPRSAFVCREGSSYPRPRKNERTINASIPPSVSGARRDDETPTPSPRRPPSERRTTLGTLLRRPESASCPTRRRDSGDMHHSLRPSSAIHRDDVASDTTRGGRETGRDRSTATMGSWGPGKLQQRSPRLTGRHGPNILAEGKKHRLEIRENGGGCGGNHYQLHERIQSGPPQACRHHGHREIHAPNGTDTAGTGGAKTTMASLRGKRPRNNVHRALKMAMRAATGCVNSREQFANARKLIEEMKRINTKDSAGALLVTTQGMSKQRINEECWISESGRQFRHRV